MNIFRLSNDALNAARMLCDKHVPKMIVETAQLLSTAHRVLDGTKSLDPSGREHFVLSGHREHELFKSTHINHPCAIWVRETIGNYSWTFRHFQGLLATYEQRWDRKHSLNRMLTSLRHNPENMGAGEETPAPQCMPEMYRGEDVVEAYRRYYIAEKASFASWRLGAPAWWPT